MKNKIFAILSLMFLLTVSGCGNDSTSNSVSSSSTQTIETTSNQTGNTSSINPNHVSYKITVLYPNGKTVPQGVRVQLCKLAEEGGLCSSEYTNDDGVAIFSLEPDTYKIDKIECDEYVFELGLKVDAQNRDKTVRLLGVIDPSAGDGSNSNPFIISDGVYNITVNDSSEIKYYGIQFSAIGTYVVESLSTSALVDPKVYSVDDSLSYEKSDPSKADVQYGNFKVTINVTEEEVNNHYLFSFGIENQTKTKKTYPIMVKCITL